MAPSAQDIRHWPLYAVIAAKAALYVLLIVTATEFTRLIMQPLNPQPLGFDRTFLTILIFAGIVSFMINAVIEVGRLLGFDVLRDLATPMPAVSAARSRSASGSSRRRMPTSGDSESFRATAPRCTAARS